MYLVDGPVPLALVAVPRCGSTFAGRMLLERTQTARFLAAHTPAWAAARDLPDWGDRIRVGLIRDPCEWYESVFRWALSRQHTRERLWSWLAAHNLTPADAFPVFVQKATQDPGSLAGLLDCLPEAATLDRVLGQADGMGLATLLLLWMNTDLEGRWLVDGLLGTATLSVGMRPLLRAVGGRDRGVETEGPRNRSPEMSLRWTPETVAMVEDRDRFLYALLREWRDFRSPFTAVWAVNEPPALLPSRARAHTRTRETGTGER